MSEYSSKRRNVWWKRASARRRWQHEPRQSLPGSDTACTRVPSSHDISRAIFRNVWEYFSGLCLSTEKCDKKFPRVSNVIEATRGDLGSLFENKQDLFWGASFFFFFFFYLRITIFWVSYILNRCFSRIWDCGVQVSCNVARWWKRHRFHVIPYAESVFQKWNILNAEKTSERDLRSPISCYIKKITHCRYWILFFLPRRAAYNRLRNSSS